MSCGTALSRVLGSGQCWSATQWHASPRHVSALTNDTAPFRQRHNVGALGSRPLGKTNFVYFQAAAATRGTVIVNGLWCSKARSRRPTIVYFGLWVGGRKAAISLRKWW